MNIQEMRERVITVSARLKELGEKTGQLTDEERAEIGRLQDEARNLTDQFALARASDDWSRAQNVAGIPAAIMASQCSTRTARPTGQTFRDVRSGAEIRAYAPTERITQQRDDQPEVNIGRCIAALAMNRFDELSPEERGAMLGGSDTAGGFLLSPNLSSQLVDLARSASVCVQAGAQTVIVSGSEMTFCKLDTDPTAYWRPEGVAVTASQLAFGKLTLRPKTLACIVPVSIELLEDSANAGAMITSVIQSAMAAQLDRALLVGTGGGSTDGIIGIRNVAGTNLETTGGTPAAWTIPSKAISEILIDNYPGPISGLSWIRHPAVAQKYDMLSAATTGIKIEKSDWVSQLREFYTTALPSTEGGGAEYAEIIGDFSQMVIGAKTSGAVVEVLREGSVTDSDSATWNATTQLMRHVRVYQRVDMVCLRPAWFCIMDDLTIT